MEATETAPVTGPDTNHPNRVRVDTLRVLHDYVVVRPLAVPSKLAGGLLHMPDTAGERERSHRGIVLVTGPGDWNEPGTALLPMTLQPSDLVFYGKYAGTEERIGPDVVLVMREQECRFSVPTGRYELVTHDDPRLDHLVEDFCEICHGIPAEQAAADSLELEREARRLQLQMHCTVCGHLGDRHAHGTGSCRDCECGLFIASAGPDAPAVPPIDAVLSADVRLRNDANESLRELAKKGKLQWEGDVPTVETVTEERRPCGHATCQYTQWRMLTDAGPLWMGIRCGHVAVG